MAGLLAERSMKILKVKIYSFKNKHIKTLSVHLKENKQRVVITKNSKLVRHQEMVTVYCTQHTNSVNVTQAKGDKAGSNCNT
jgi:hypothetical protein